MRRGVPWPAYAAGLGAVPALSCWLRGGDTTGPAAAAGVRRYWAVQYGMGVSPVWSQGRRGLVCLGYPFNDVLCVSDGVDALLARGFVAGVLVQP